MTPEEYIQLKAFARQDGALLSLLWIGGFICYIQGMTNPLLGMLAIILIVISPFFVARRLRHFRDYAREGFISFGRGYAFTVLTFFYAGLLLAAALYVYFAFIDQGYLTDDMITREYLRWLYTALTRATERVYLLGFEERFFGDSTDNQ